VSSPTLLDLALSILPMLLLVGAWAFFMWRMNKTGGGSYTELERRKVEALERIDKALEQRKP
jgi:ATP-dependent Zn protease